MSELRKRIEELEKEISLQRQRINIINNQIDYIIKNHKKKEMEK